MSEHAMFQLEEYVKVIATGAIGRVEQWTQETDQYFVEFNRDSSSRQWFAPAELERAEPSAVRNIVSTSVIAKY
jgi:hypothetical protein